MTDTLITAALLIMIASLIYWLRSPNHWTPYANTFGRQYGSR
jgi:hypothetical protein